MLVTDVCVLFGSMLCVVCTNAIGAVSVKAFLTGSDEVDMGEEMVREGLAVYLSETVRPHTPNSPHSEPSEDEDDSSTEAAIPTAGNKVLYSVPPVHV